MSKQKMFEIECRSIEYGTVHIRASNEEEAKHFVRTCPDKITLIEKWTSIELEPVDCQPNNCLDEFDKQLALLN
jgi:hypothetical protein